MVKAITKSRKPTVALVKRLAKFRGDRKTLETLGESIKIDQKELISAMREADPDNHGIVYDPDDESKGAAYVQQNTPGEFWNESAIIDWLRMPIRGRKALWLSCSTRVLDIQKFEAEVAAGNIPAKVATRFKERGKASAPFIRFGKITNKNRS